MLYEIGDVAPLTQTFTNPSGAPTNPTAVTLIVQAPDGTQVILTWPVVSVPPITNTSAGVFVCNIPVTLSGVYSYTWAGTGTVIQAFQGSLTCASSLLTQLGRPNPIDLTSLDFVKAYLGNPPETTTNDILLSRMITGMSAAWLRKTGYGPADNSIPTQSPFVQPVSYNENYDGSGSVTQFVRNRPIRSVSSVIVNGTTIPQSTGQPQSAGWQIDSSGKSIVMINPGCGPGYGYGTGGGWGAGWSGGGYYPPTTFGTGYAFFAGKQNVNIQYIAGFTRVPDDIFEAVGEMVALIQKQRGWLGLKSVAMAAGGGTTVYDNVTTPKRTQDLLEYYKRRAIV